MGQVADVLILTVKYVPFKHLRFSLQVFICLTQLDVIILFSGIHDF